MALRDNEQQYYYFKMRLGNPHEIKVTAIHINTAINRIYVEMSEEQKAFYLEHPTATVQEVWNCELAQPYVPPTPDVEQYAAMKVFELENVCQSSVSVTALEYMMANAVLAGTSVAYPGEKYYSIVEARSVMKRFMDESALSMGVLDKYRPRITAASSTGEIDTIFEAAIAELNTGLS